MEEEVEEREVCLTKDQGKVVEEPDEGELMALRRALSALKGAPEEQRDNIFRSKCSV